MNKQLFYTVKQLSVILIFTFISGTAGMNPGACVPPEMYPRTKSQQEAYDKWELENRMAQADRAQNKYIGRFDDFAPIIMITGPDICKEITESKEKLMQSYKNSIVRISDEKNAERERHSQEKVTLLKQMSEQSEKAAREYLDVRSQLSPSRARANEVSPLRAQVKAKDDEIQAQAAEIAQLKRMLAARPSYASMTSTKQLPK